MCCRTNSVNVVVLFFLLLMLTNPAASQSRSSDSFYLKMPFAHQLITLTNKDSISKAKLEMTSIQNRMALHSDSKLSFSLSDRWRLVSFITEGWKDVAGRITETQVVCTNRRDHETFTGAEIFNAFGISDTLLKRGFPLKAIPDIFQRNDTYQTEWTPVYAIHDYLVMRYVHSYPYGNITSWYYETLYYFKKES